MQYNKTRSIEGKYRFWEFAVSVYMVWCTMQWSGFEGSGFGSSLYRFPCFQGINTNKDLLWKDFCMNLFACCICITIHHQLLHTIFFCGTATQCLGTSEKAFQAPSIEESSMKLTSSTRSLHTKWCFPKGITFCSSIFKCPLDLKNS